jgi:hypothetical protein
MFRTMSVRGLILVLVLALGAPLASATGSREREELSVHGVLSALWETLTGFFPLLAETTSDNAPGDPNSGPGMDPNGNPKGP